MSRTETNCWHIHLRLRRLIHSLRRVAKSEGRATITPAVRCREYQALLVSFSMVCRTLGCSNRPDTNQRPPSSASTSSPAVIGEPRHPHKRAIFSTQCAGYFDGRLTLATSKPTRPRASRTQPARRAAASLSGPKMTLPDTKRAGRSGRRSGFGSMCCSTRACAAVNPASSNSTGGESHLFWVRRRRDAQSHLLVPGNPAASKPPNLHGLRDPSSHLVQSSAL
jgi:hypothetical protein